MSVRIVRTSISGVLVIEPRVHCDDRGSFFESFNQRIFSKEIGEDIQFVQDNQSTSFKRVLRGMHYQIKQPQGKLVRVIRGGIYDVAVDLRVSSADFGQYIGVHLSAENKRQLWIPEGFAHGFLTTTEVAEVAYKTTDYYAPEHERCISWNDPTIGVDWGKGAGEPVLSEKDSRGAPLGDAELFS